MLLRVGGGSGRAGTGQEEPSALLVAIQAGMHVEDLPSAVRSVLQAVQTAIPFDWAAVLRFVAGERELGAEVVATYPGPMAGAEEGVTWTPLDANELIIARSGEPTLHSSLSRQWDDRSPLARLSSLGMRTRLGIPLFRGGEVTGCVLLFSEEADAYDARDGIRIERLVRALGQRLPPGPRPPEAGEPSAAGEEAAPPPAAAEEAAPAPRIEETEEPRRSFPGGDRPRGRVESVEQRLTSLGEMVSGVAHELNNPLTAILGYSQLLPSLEGDERSLALGTIEEQALRASRIVRNLLAFARQHRASTRPVDVEAILERVVEVRRHALQADGISLETRFGGVPRVLGDEYQLEQVFLNLLNNAYEAMRGEGGIVTIETAHSHGAVQVAISDTGPGVPDEVAERIFEPFFTTRDVGAGAGMGLAIVYGIVAEHGGHVWLEQGRTRGARFVVELPLAERAVPRATPDVPPAGRRQAARILVADDELPIRALTNEILTSAGYEVQTAASAEEALRTLDDERFDLVVADSLLPGISSEEFLRRAVTRHPELQGRIVLVTGDTAADQGTLREGERGVRYLEKPFDTHELLDVVREALTAGESADAPGPDDR